jgi:hypothetical protein
MAVAESLYPYVLAGMNVTSGWLLYDLLDATLGVILLAVGAILLLAVGLESTRVHVERVLT